MPWRRVGGEIGNGGLLEKIAAFGSSYRRIRSA
jgi:hypothetical protein